jgi:hypothetical protein
MFWNLPIHNIMLFYTFFNHLESLPENNTYTWYTARGKGWTISASVFQSSLFEHMCRSKIICKRNEAHPWTLGQVGSYIAESEMEKASKISYIVFSAWFPNPRNAHMLLILSLSKCLAIEPGGDPCSELLLNRGWNNDTFSVLLTISYTHFKVPAQPRECKGIATLCSTRQ